MKRIYKYVFGVQDELITAMPKGAIIRHVGTQCGNIVIWAEVDTKVVTELKEFRVYGTGHPIDPNFDTAFFIGTVMIGAYVWHIYEKR